MNISEEKKENQKIYTIEVINRSRSKKINYSIESIEKSLREKFDLDEYELLSSKSSNSLTNSRTRGKYFFKRKALDIPVNYVKIDIPIVEAEFPPLVDEEKPKEEKASLSSEKLPIGLKKVKKKRTTKKKTEE